MSLIFVPTPIGNLRDVTLRALEILRDCDLVVAEDTRVARRLLGAHGIGHKELWSYREANAAVATPAILQRAALGVVALLSDAGMPAISDPGRELVAAARAAGIALEVLPGASAFVCAAVLSGFPLDGLTFEGFLPRAAGERERVLQRALARGATTVWYEAPHRILATLAALERLAPDATAFLGRELTKLHEQQLWGTAAQIAAGLERPVRGELTLVLGPRSVPAVAPEAAEVDAAIDAALAAGTAPTAIAKALARENAGTRQALYARVIERKSRRAGSAREDA
ncbi:MAG TPA: 16S rRNA (cytidine(1402)-2'-O)-methyltransferase [Candidatus Baltobacteraceae bacterium]|nr:16S rRNA (cytidine(1402)-2'-O)-methyltransferase [Candidatus Baltobacteraceae bacterium]